MMARYLLVLVVFTIPGGLLAAEHKGGSRWKLVWKDEFSKSAIDGKNWTHEVNGKGGGNNELQYYTDRRENSRVQKGFLILEARKETHRGRDGTREYTSARLNTKGKACWKYGAFEFRARMPRGKGIWPAVWMLPEKNEYGTWAASGEIDIMEYLGHEPNRVHGTLHYGGKWPRNTHSGKSFTLERGDFSSQFHVFRMEWEEKEFRWYVDGKLYQTQKKWRSDGHPFPAPFDKPFHLVLNVAVGGRWPGNPDERTRFPQQMIVDYIRVYQRS
jgi:beta-glucanase (GH16 family)